ncbi:Uncharacterised protein [Mycobacteroides abscessus subsp. abscessus]|nr:Uncharacterised protein [Mycobacteroides abscessus subsp. abscessus]
MRALALIRLKADLKRPGLTLGWRAGTLDGLAEVSANIGHRAVDRLLQLGE